jgi:hypothetical protein
MPVVEAWGIGISIRTVPRWCVRHQVLYSVGECRIERDERVGLELGQGDLSGVRGVRPPEGVGDLSCEVLKDPVSEQSNPQPPHVVERALGVLHSHLSAA